MRGAIWARYSGFQQQGAEKASNDACGVKENWKTWKIFLDYNDVRISYGMTIHMLLSECSTCSMVFYMIYFLTLPINCEMWSMYHISEWVSEMTSYIT